MNGPGRMPHRMKRGGSYAGARSAAGWNCCGSRSATVTTTGKKKTPAGCIRWGFYGFKSI